MKLATLHDGSRHGQLAVISPDLSHAHYASGIAATMQQALDDWNFIAPQLQTLYEALARGQARHAFAFDPARCLAPLPCTAQLAFATGEPPASFPAPALPVMELAAGDTLRGPAQPWQTLPGLAADFEPQLAALCAAAPRAATPEQGQDAIRLLTLACALRLRKVEESAESAPAPADSRPATIFAPVAITPDELGQSWQGGQPALTLQVQLNGRKTALLDAARAWPLGHAVAASARVRALAPGAVLAAGVPPANSGHASLAARRASGLPAPWLQSGDTLLIQARSAGGPGAGDWFGPLQIELG